ncbi:MAG: MFS transporter [Candidatus Paceibacterota bacterium]
MKIKHDRKIIYLAGFLFSIPLALTSYINSSFLSTYINEYYVGIVYIIASIISIFGLLKMPKILNNLGNRFTILMFTILSFLSLLTLAFSHNVFTSIFGIIAYFISTNFIVASLDIFIEDFSKNSNIGKFRGFYLMIINFAWVIAQTISGSIIAKSSFQGIYLFGAGIMLLTSFIFVFFLHDFKDPKYIKEPILKTIKTFIKNSSLSKIYLINLILKFFFAWMVIYTPIYLYEHIGFNWEQIGFIFTIMLIPFILLDFPLGKLSDKIGERKILLLGFFTTILFTFFIPFIKNPEVWIWAIILFGTRIGGATIEVMAESYFFKEITDKNADEISFFRNTYPLSFIIAPLIAIPILLLVPSFEYLFFVLSVILLIGFFITLRLKDVK